jgi:hypothetical protein
VSEGEYDPDHPWDRQPCDSPQSWAAFRLFLTAAPPRSLRGVALDLAGVSLATVERWADECMWSPRAACHDAARSAPAVSSAGPVASPTLAPPSPAAAPALPSPAEQRALLADMIALCKEEIAKFVATSRQSDMPGLLRPGEIARLTEVAIKFDRLLRGESTENVATAATVDLSALSLEELRALRVIQQKIGS